jgi:hypothetical protein
MRFIRVLLVVLLFEASSTLAATPDELALKARASRFYELQVAGKHAEAARLVAPESRQIFLNGHPVAYKSYRIERVLIRGRDAAEVEVTAEILFPPPILSVQPRTFSVPWKKISGQWYFVVDPAVLDIVARRQTEAGPKEKPVLSFKPLVTFGLDGEIQRSLRLENNSSGAIQFRIASFEEECLDIKNRKGEIPAGEYFPLVLVLKKIPNEQRKTVVMVEGVDASKRITQLEIPIELQVPSEPVRKEILKAIRKYREEQ